MQLLKCNLYMLLIRSKAFGNTLCCGTNCLVVIAARLKHAQPEIGSTQQITYFFPGSIFTTYYLPCLITETHTLTSNPGPTTTSMVIHHHTISTTPRNHTRRMTKAAMITTRRATTEMTPTQTHKVPVHHMCRKCRERMTIPTLRQGLNSELLVLWRFFEESDSISPVNPEILRAGGNTSRLVACGRG